MQLCGLEFGAEALPDGNGEIFSRRDRLEKFRNLFIQEAVIEGIEDLAVHDVFQLLKVDDESRTRIDRAFDCDFKRVVVPVTIRVVALAENALVLLRREIRIVVIVRSGEFSFTREIDHSNLVKRACKT